MSEHAPIPRKMVLTDADIMALSEMLKKDHPCRFDSMTPEDMDFVKDLLVVYKETRSEVIKWFVKGVVYGTIILIVIGLYFKVGVKH